MSKPIAPSVDQIGTPPPALAAAECRSTRPAHAGRDQRSAPRQHTLAHQHRERVYPAFACVAGWSITAPTQHGLAERIVAAAEHTQPFAVTSVGLSHLTHLRHNAALRDAVGRARFVMAGSTPLAWLASRQCPGIEATQMPALVARLTTLAARRGLRMFLVGTEGGAIARAALHLASRHPDTLALAGTAVLPQGSDPSGEMADEILERIAAAEARLTLVALDAPHQEIFAARGVAHGIPSAFVCVGSTFARWGGRASRHN